MVDIDIGQRVRALRERCELSQQEAADRGGFPSRSLIANIEWGRNKATSHRTRERLADAFGVARSRLDAYLEGEIELADLKLRSGK